MAVGNICFPEMNKVSGLMLGTAKAAIKQTEKDDILIVQMTEGTKCAAVFTQNIFAAAPVHIAKDHLPQEPQWLLVNSGNANAGTSQQGIKDAINCCQSLAKVVNGKSQQVLPFSTGVIGELLPVEKINQAIPNAVANLAENNWKNAAYAIMTTDTFAKGASLVFSLNGHPVTITGISKGSGMIQPNMATMLGFIATDAKISQALLQQCLLEVVEQSFNLITVDGDTSTNDACILMASGCSSAPMIEQNSKDYELFKKAVLKICKQLAELVIRDGEGATKLMRIQVEQAANNDEAILVGKTIANSALVKTAFFASDPNWGRILAAIGRSGIKKMDLDKIEIYLDDVCIVKKGGRATSYTEEKGQNVMNREEILVRVILGRGNAEQEILSCDFSYDYIRINSEYRT